MPKKRSGAQAAPLLRTLTLGLRGIEKPETVLDVCLPGSQKAIWANDPRVQANYQIGQSYKVRSLRHGPTTRDGA
jgi:hypothetical protein